MIQDLARSGLTDEDVFAEPLVAVPPHKKREWIIAAYKIPYLSVDGGIHPHMFRVRVLYAPHITAAMQKEADVGKYTQPPREYLAQRGVRGNFPYMPSGRIKSDVLIICEGEKKAVAAQNRFKCCIIGLGGAHCWRSEAGSRDVHPEILNIVRGRSWGRIICIADPDYGSNQDVAGGWNGLALRIEADIVVLDDKLDDLLVQDERIDLEWILGQPVVSTEMRQLGRQDLVDTYRLDVLQNGNLVYTHKNYIALLENHPKWEGMIKRNEDSGLIEYCGHDFEETADTARATIYLGEHLFMRLANPTKVHEAIRAVADMHKYSPLRDEIRSETWDKKQRARYIFGKDRSPNEYAIAEAWAWGYVQRVLHPGCFWRLMVVLVGPQGVGKTGSAKWLVGEHGRVANIHAGELRAVGKDVAMKFMRANVCIFDDIDTLHKADEGALKSMVSMESTYMRQSYAREEKVWLRRGIVMGTSNQKVVLPYDPTGNTRFVALEIHKMLDWDWLYDNRGQILAELRDMKEPKIDFSLMAQYVEHDALYEACEEWVELFNGKDKSIVGMCLRNASGKLYFKSESFWWWHRKMDYYPSMAERKRMGSYLRAMGMVFYTSSMVRVDGKPIKNVWGA
jgi:hypothetical protein